MFRRYSFLIYLALAFLALSGIFYFIHFLIFQDVHHIFIYLIGDIAFVFFEVLLVTLVLHQLLHHREKKAMLNKLNMVIGAFFSEVGTELLVSFSQLDPCAEEITKKLVVSNEWSEQELKDGRKSARSFSNLTLFMTQAHSKVSVTRQNLRRKEPNHLTRWATKVESRRHKQ